MLMFNSDGTVLQSNPDEVTADRTTREFVSRREISLSIKVSGNEFTGSLTASFRRRRIRRFV